MPLVKTEIQLNLGKLLKSLKSAPKHLTPEDVHKLRTRARRIISLSDGHSLPALDHTKLAKRLKRIRKKAGRVRDMDVLTAHLAAMRSDQDPSCRTQLLECLGAKRYRRADRLVELLEDKAPQLRKQLRRVAKDTDGRRGKITRKAHTKQSAQVLELTAGLSEPASLNKSNLHPYRLKVKELRDALRMAGGTKDSRFANELSRSKNAIGEWHDWEELIAIAEKTLNHRPECPLLNELKSISKHKFDSALTIAEKLRTDYARTETPKVRARNVKATSSTTRKTKARKAKGGRPQSPSEKQAPSDLPPIPERALKAVAGVVH